MFIILEAAIRQGVENMLDIFKKMRVAMTLTSNRTIADIKPEALVDLSKLLIYKLRSKISRLLVELCILRMYFQQTVGVFKIVVKVLARDLKIPIMHRTQRRLL